MKALATAARGALQKAGVPGTEIEAIALDTTGSSVIPVDKNINLPFGGRSIAAPYLGKLQTLNPQLGRAIPAASAVTSVYFNPAPVLNNTTRSSAVKNPVFNK